MANPAVNGMMDKYRLYSQDRRANPYTVVRQTLMRIYHLEQVMSL